MKNAKKIAAALGAALMGVLLIVSCDSFFSSSWGDSREYNTSNIEVTTDNVDTWIENAKGNPELAAAVTKKIKEQLKGKVKQGNPTEEQVKLQQSGVTLTVEAAGISTSILSNGSSAVTAFQNNDPNALPNLIKGIQKDFKDNKGPEAASDLAEIVSGSLKAGSTDKLQAPEFCDAFTEGLNPVDVGLAVTVLTLSMLDKKGLDANDPNVHLKVEELGIGLAFDADANRLVVDPSKNSPPNTTPSQEAVTLAAYLNLIYEDTDGKYGGNKITQGMGSALKP